MQSLHHQKYARKDGAANSAGHAGRHRQRCRGSRAARCRCGRRRFSNKRAWHRRRRRRRRRRRGRRGRRRGETCGRVEPVERAEHPAVHSRVPLGASAAPAPGRDAVDRPRPARLAHQRPAASPLQPSVVRPSLVTPSAQSMLSVTAAAGEAPAKASLHWALLKVTTCASCRVFGWTVPSAAV